MTTRTTWFSTKIVRYKRVFLFFYSRSKRYVFLVTRTQSQLDHGTFYGINSVPIGSLEGSWIAVTKFLLGLSGICVLQSKRDERETFRLLEPA